MVFYFRKQRVGVERFILKTQCIALRKKYFYCERKKIGFELMFNHGVLPYPYTIHMTYNIM